MIRKKIINWWNNWYKITSRFQIERMTKRGSICSIVTDAKLFPTTGHNNYMKGLNRSLIYAVTYSTLRTCTLISMSGQASVISSLICCKMPVHVILVFYPLGGC